MIWHFIYVCLIGIAAGWLATKLMKKKQFGLAGNLIVGVIGALVGGFLIPLIGFTPRNLIGDLLTATAGSALILFLLRYVK